MATLGVIADDLTGATDIAIALTSAGYRTTVVRVSRRSRPGRGPPPRRRCP
ncbi:four-carbon acid sugar kinase family protein, partial [Nocardiopsis alba]|uniref:four-carbon acid sugar kinase family protein n=1 Tax=Nocardiopsis alba TaxID=53437 RepID=UPI0033A2D816